MARTVIEYVTVRTPRAEHSRWGIASFVLAMLALLPVGLACTDAVNFDWRNADGPDYFVLGIFLLGGLCLSVAGFVCGIPAVAKRGPKHLYSRLGFWLNGLMLLGLIIVSIVTMILIH